MKKQAVVLRKKNYVLYRIQNEELSLLADFLTSEIAGDIDAGFYREWIADNQRNDTGGNWSDLAKSKEHIVIRDIYDVNFDTSDEISIKISRDNFIEILDSWKKLHKTMPAKITIIKTDKGIVLEPSNTVNPEDVTRPGKLGFKPEDVITLEQIQKVAHILPDNVVELEDLIIALTRKITMLPKQDKENIIEFARNNECELALETLCVQLHEHEVSITSEEYQEIKTLCELITIDEKFLTLLKQLIQNNR